MKPLNFGSTFVYSMCAVAILCCSATLRALGTTAQLVFVGIVGVAALVLIVHSAIVLFTTSSDTNRKMCKINILYACVFVTAALIPFAMEKILFEWANYRVSTLSK